jgi:hypothetical protein
VHDLNGAGEISAEMQFIQNGPDIPDRLLQAHEDGKVVFFCGAGISYPAGLPGFEGLASKLYDNFTTSPTARPDAFSILFGDRRLIVP